MTTFLFQDEFNGAALDPAKWSATPWPDSSSPDDTQIAYTTKNIYVGGGCLHLAVTAGSQGRLYDAARVQTFVDGGWPPKQVLASVAPPVRVEARIRFAPGAGLWGAFWPMGVNSSNPIEIDAVELRGKYPKRCSTHVHNVTEWAGGIDYPADLTAGFHTYTVDYLSDRVVFRLDGQQVGVCMVVCRQPIGVRLSNVVGPPTRWGGEGGPPAPARVPAVMSVDYVRAWKP